MTERLLAAIEGGGTKFLCALGNAEKAVASVKIATADPETTIAGIAEFFRQAMGAHGQPAALGVANFGPLTVDPDQPGFGILGPSPKVEWAGFDLRGALQAILPCPLAIETDVNAAALAESRIGAARGCDPVAYVTVGTGIGVGVVAGGRPLHGLRHPEGGHIFPRRHVLHQDFAGICARHGDCLEGLASGPAIEEFWGIAADDLPDNHPAWDVEAAYLAQLCHSLALLLSPQRIVLGGGVMKRADLLPKTGKALLGLLGGFIPALEDDPKAIENFLVAPGCQLPSGLAGAFLLASDLV